MNMFRMMRIATGVEKLRNDPKKSFRKGYSLAELILGAAVIAAFLVRIYQAYAATSDADKFEDLTAEVGLINGTVHQDFINTSSFDGLAPSSVLGSLPRKYTSTVNTPASGGNAATSSSSIVTAYGTTIDVGATGSDSSGFFISVTLPTQDCVKAALGDMGRNLDAITGGAGSGTVPTTLNAPLNGTEAEAQCTTGVNSDGTSTIGYYFH